MGHAADLHEGQKVTLVVAALVLKCLKGANNVWLKKNAHLRAKFMSKQGSNLSFKKKKIKCKSASFPHLGSGEIAVELPLFKRVSHLSPLANGIVSVGQAHVNGDHRSILWSTRIRADFHQRRSFGKQFTELKKQKRRRNAFIPVLFQFLIRLFNRESDEVTVTDGRGLFPLSFFFFFFAPTRRKAPPDQNVPFQLIRKWRANVFRAAEVARTTLCVSL